jgi:hypothetical protein
MKEKIIFLKNFLKYGFKINLFSKKKFELKNKKKFFKYIF